MIGRPDAMLVITTEIMLQLNLFDHIPQINQQIFTRFLNKIQKGYYESVQYHNDIHAADVLQMAHHIMLYGGVNKFANLTDLDLLSVVISSVCHDFGHDGMNNAYHVNAISDKAIRYSDQSVQENFHIAESFAILNDPVNNFISDLPRDDFRTFRKRMIGIILATDMARHFTDLTNFKSVMASKNITNGKNQAAMIDKESATKEFDSKQQLMEMIVHAADVSTQVRPFKVALTWTWLLFEEFFDEGDLEKEQNLPISFLCDRSSVQITQSQPGFMNYIVIPLFSTVADLMPGLKHLEDAGKDNLANWQQYEETEKDKEIYKPKIVKSESMPKSNSLGGTPTVLDVKPVDSSNQNSEPGSSK